MSGPRQKSPQSPTPNKIVDLPNLQAQPGCLPARSTVLIQPLLRPKQNKVCQFLPRVSRPSALLSVAFPRDRWRFPFVPAFASVILERGSRLSEASEEGRRRQHPWGPAIPGGRECLAAGRGGVGAGPAGVYKSAGASATNHDNLGFATSSGSRNSSSSIILPASKREKGLE